MCTDQRSEAVPAGETGHNGVTPARIDEEFGRIGLMPVVSWKWQEPEPEPRPRPRSTRATCKLPGGAFLLLDRPDGMYDKYWGSASVSAIGFLKSATDADATIELLELLMARLNAAMVEVAQVVEQLRRAKSCA